MEDVMHKKSKFSKRNNPFIISKNDVAVEPVMEDSFEFSASNLSHHEGKKEILAELNDMGKRKSHEELTPHKPY
jgi:hypothetical protein